MEPSCPSCGSADLRQIEISGANRKQSILFSISVFALILSIAFFIAIYYSIFMSIISAALFAVYFLTRRAAADVPLTELRCLKCGWFRRG